MWPTNTSGEMSAEWTTVTGAVSGGTAAARQGSEFSLLHIVLITFGGVVFVIGFLIVIVLLKSRKKLFAGNATNRGGRFPRQSPIFVVGQGRGQGRGGDNPAFCRTDENNGGLPFPRNGAATASQMRLPTYEEVITGRVPTAVVRSNLRVHQHQHQQGHRQPPAAPAVAETSGGGGGATVGSERPGRVTPPPRYAFDYPSCYWEEVPPPPYASVAGTAARALGRGPALTRESARGRGPERVLARRDHESCGRGPASPYSGRAPLAVPTPTVLSPAQSPALPPRNHSQAQPSSSSAVPSTVPHPVRVPTTLPASAHVPMMTATSALPPGDPSSYPSCLPPRGGQFLLTSAALPTAGSYNAALTRALPALWDNGTRPLAASSPAVPRRHPPPADLAASSRPNNPVMPVLLSYRTLTPAHYRSRSDGAGGWQGPVLVGGATLGRTTATVPSAPIARFDIDL